jgi:Tfp pilus assembly PilM family ATPase
MFNFVQNWLAPTARPIGVDVGSSCLRMAQVQYHGSEPRLIAAASADLPLAIHYDPDAHRECFGAAARRLLNAGNFRGRQILLALPAAMTSIVSLRLPAADKEQTTLAIAAAVREQFGMDPDAALIRVYKVNNGSAGDGETQDLIVIAASRVRVNALISAASEAGLEVVGMSVEPQSLIDCFSHVYRRRGDLTSTSCFVEIGWTSTRVVVARAGNILSAGKIDIGGSTFAGALASAISVSAEEAKLQRVKICHADTQLESRDKRELHVVRPANHDGEIDRQRQAIESACRPSQQALLRELEKFRDRFGQRFPGRPIDRLVFVGGEAHNRGMCRSIARAMGLSALIGDSMLRMGRSSEIRIESGIDRREPQPAWSVAVGLTLGAAAVQSGKGDLGRPVPFNEQRKVQSAETQP